MKYLISWHPNPPDPHYWKWFKPHGIAISFANTPLKFIEKAVTKGIHNTLGFNGFILLDSLPQNPNINQTHLLRLQSWMKPDIAVHRDYPLLDKTLTQQQKWKLLAKTVRNAEAAAKLEDKLGIKILYVIQGWDPQTYTWCAQQYTQLGIKNMGLGSMKNAPSEKIVQIAKQVRQTIGNKVHLHLFGALKPSTLPKLSKHIDTVDSSTPIQAAIRKEILIPHKNRLKRTKIENISIEDLTPHLPKKLTPLIYTALADETQDQLKTDAKKARAIINAYILTKYVQSL